MLLFSAVINTDESINSGTNTANQDDLMCINAVTLPEFLSKTVLSSLAPHTRQHSLRQFLASLNESDSPYSNLSQEIFLISVDMQLGLKRMLRMVLQKVRRSWSWMLEIIRVTNATFVFTVRNHM